MEQAIPGGAQVHVTIGWLPAALPDRRLRERAVRLSAASVRRGFAPRMVLPGSVEVMMISVRYLAGRRVGAPVDILSPNSTAAPIAPFSAAAHEPGLATNSASPVIASSAQVPAQFAQQLYGKPSVLQCDPYTTLAANSAAIAAYSEATRDIERQEVGPLQQMLSGFQTIRGPRPPTVAQYIADRAGTVRDKGLDPARLRELAQLRYRDVGKAGRMGRSTARQKRR